MISFNNALKLMRQSINVSKKTETINIYDSHKRVISKKVLSKNDNPKSDVSAMDGIVIFKEKSKKNNVFKIIGESKAGNKDCINFKKDEALLIYTGAPVPGKNKVIIPKENYTFYNSQKLAKIERIDKRRFVRFKGEDFRKNKTYFLENEIINVRAMSLAITMGLKTINVKKKPNIYVIVTGDELITKNNPKGIIESSNEVVINMLVKKFGGNLKGTFTVKDNEKDFLSIFNNLKNYDLLITSGGISKGRYDIVKKVLKKKKLKILFDQIAVKPGKPTTFGKLGSDKYFLGLPGNPVSCFISMLFYFSKFINCFYGTDFIRLREKKMKINHVAKKNNHLTNFLRIGFVGKKSENFFVFENQDSSMQKILKESDGIWIRKPREMQVKKNSYCNIIALNDSFLEEI